MKAALINTLKTYLKSQPVDKAWVFGSYARGEETSKSDIDIMVSYIPGHRPGLFGICALIDGLEKVLGLKVDLVEQGTLYPRIAKEVEIQKIPVYELSEKF